MAVSGRPPGAIWAGYLFAPNIKAATWQNARGVKRFDRDQMMRARRIRQFDHGSAASLFICGYLFARHAGLWPWTGVIMVTVGAARVHMATALGG